MEKGLAIPENETRKMIYNHIRAHPGVSFIVLKKVFDLNESTLRYHLNYLEKKEKISLGLESGKRNYYPHLGNRLVVHNSEDPNTLETYELTSIQEQIIETIKMYPQINQKELVKKTGINRLSLSKNLKKLMNLCILRQIPNGNKVNYEYIQNDQLRYEILKKLLVKLLKKEITEEQFLELKRKLD